MKILGFHYSCNKKIQQEKDFKSHITKIENVLQIWKMRQLTLDRRITTFKFLGISKIMRLDLMNSISAEIICFLNKILSFRKIANQKLNLNRYAKVTNMKT